MKDKIINITSRSFTDTFLLKLILVVLIALIICIKQMSDPPRRNRIGFEDFGLKKK